MKETKKDNFKNCISKLFFWFLKEYEKEYETFSLESKEKEKELPREWDKNKNNQELIEEWQKFEFINNDANK